MVERIKNKKGFTIIEVMVVIALIGILAAVLVPKFTGVKDTARNTGMLSNARVVEAYVASIIDNYKDSEAADMEAAIEAQFATDGENALENPYSGDAATVVCNVLSSSATYTFEESGAAETIYVYIDPDDLTTYINGYDQNAEEIASTERTVSK